jgi:PAS domain S-box-containing protein
LYGYKSESTLGHKITELIPADRRAEESAILEKLLAGEHVDHFETVRRRSDGSLVEVSLTISLIRDEAGEVVGTSEVARDVTEQKRTAELMRQTQKLESLGVLAGGIAHDFNNLLVGVLGNSSLALDLLEPDSPVRSLLEGVMAAGENAAGLTQQMLAYSGKAHFVLTKLNLSARVRETIPLIQAAVSRSVELRLDLEDDLPPIDADASQVQQIVMNLAINAAEAIPESRRGRVLIKTYGEVVDEQSAREQFGVAAGEITPGQYAVLEVYDNGCGMDESTRARIFEPFFTTKFTGRGLGLAAVLGIIRGHAGFIQVASTPGEGSVFRVLIPGAGATSKERPDVIAESDNLNGRGVVLIIDDEEIVRKVTKRTFEAYGYTAHVAEDGDRGLDLFRRHRDAIDCILLDATMPGLSGEETLKLLKACRPEVPVVLSSGFGETEMLRRFAGKGLAGFIQKPYKTAAILKKVKEVIGASANPPRAIGVRGAGDS